MNERIKIDAATEWTKASQQDCLMKLQFHTSATKKRKAEEGISLSSKVEKLPDVWESNREDQIELAERCL